MPIKPRTRITLLYVGAIIFALNAILAFAAGYEAHQAGKNARAYIARGAIWLLPSIAFIRIARNRRKALQADQDIP